MHFTAFTILGLTTVLAAAAPNTKRAGDTTTIALYSNSQCTIEPSGGVVNLPMDGCCVGDLTLPDFNATELYGPAVQGSYSFFASTDCSGDAIANAGASFVGCYAQNGPVRGARSAMYLK